MSKILSTFMLQMYFEPIIRSCTIWEKKDLSVYIIANVYSGGFTQKNIALKNKNILIKQSEISRNLPSVVNSIKFTICETEYARHGSEIVDQIFKNYCNSSDYKIDSDKKILIITAGGDGTSLEVQTSILKLAMTSEKYKLIIRNNFSVLRLPFGTGNDGSDGRMLEESLDRLTKPSHIEYQKAIKVCCKQGDKLINQTTWYAFNIASIGIDAYITHMTNRMKKILPGDFYKLWVDLACLFYRKKFKNGEAKIDFYDKENNYLSTYNGKIEFCLLGVSGQRTYGSNHKILPTDDNCCITKSMSLISKLVHMKSFEDGTHINGNVSFFYRANKIVIDYKDKILLQLDGESYLMNGENFPLTMELTEPVIPVIVFDNNLVDKGTEK